MKSCHGEFPLIIFYSVLLIYANKFAAGLDDDTTDSRIIYLVSALSIAGTGYFVSPIGQKLYSPVRKLVKMLPRAFSPPCRDFS